MTPTRKWAAARVTAAAAFAVLVITTGFGIEAQIALVGFLAESAVSYLVPNAEPLPVGGVGVGPDPDDLTIISRHDEGLARGGIVTAPFPIVGERGPDQAKFSRPEDIKNLSDPDAPWSPAHPDVETPEG